MTKRKTSKEIVMERLTESLLNSLEAEKIPWQKGYSNKSYAPQNAITGNQYSGINASLLYLWQNMNGYLDPRWCTYKKANEKGWKIKKGSKSVPIFYFSLVNKDTNKTVYPSAFDGLSEAGKKELRDKCYILTKHYLVFNASQIDGIPPFDKLENKITFNNHLADEYSKRVIDGMKIEVSHGFEPSYVPSEDKVYVPAINQVTSEEDYYDILFHELAHATGHESRIDRSLGNVTKVEEYAKEELIAEFSAFITAVHLGYKQTGKEIENNVAYCQHWYERISKEPGIVNDALSNALNIYQYFDNYGQLEELETTYQENNQIEDLVDHVPEQKMGKVKETIITEDNQPTQQMSKSVEKLVEDGIVTRWEKKPQYFFVKGLKKVALELGPDGEFIVSKIYPPKDNDLQRVNEILNYRYDALNKEVKLEDKHLRGEEKKSLLKNSISLIDYAQHIGFGVIKQSGGLYYLEEHDSCKIYPNNTFYRYSNESGGDIFSFIQEFEECSFPEAMNKAIDYYNEFNPEPIEGLNNVTSQASRKLEGIELPINSPNNDKVIHYLTKVRGIDEGIVNKYIKQGILYQDDQNNCVFVGKVDKTPFYATKRSSYEKSRYRGDVKGSFKEVGVYQDNGSTTLIVTESVIDAMSYASNETNPYGYNYLSVNGAASASKCVRFHLERRGEAKGIERIVVALDNDQAGFDSTLKVLEMLDLEYPHIQKYQMKPKGKDFNEDLMRYVHGDEYDQYVPQTETVSATKTEDMCIIEEFE